MDFVDGDVVRVCGMKGERGVKFVCVDGWGVWEDFVDVVLCSNGIRVMS